MSHVLPVEKSSLCMAFLQGMKHELITWRPKTKISTCYTKTPLSSPAMNFKWRSWKLTFEAINSCFLRIYLYTLIQLLLSVIVVHFECYVRQFVERGLGCCTKTSAFFHNSRTHAANRTCDVMTQFMGGYGTHFLQSRCRAICLESSGLQTIYSRHWCEASSFGMRSVLRLVMWCEVK